MKNNKEKYFLRLKDLENIASDNVDITIIMKEVLGYKNYPIGRKFVFENKAKKALHMINEARSVDPKECIYNPNCGIKIPQNIDYISFRAMMELRSTIGNSDDSNFTNTVAQIISIVCYQENNKDINGKPLKYDSNCIEFKNFTKKILNSYVWDMMGVYNWIDKAEKESQKNWLERFMSVHVEDKDFENAGAESLNQFNVLKTIKILCRDFNVGYEKAWQMSYALTQTNSYEIATTNFVKNQLTKLKEIKMKNERKNNS